ncbi:MAG: hypothetical protein WCA81_09125 [Rhizomicrobium sp.]
MAKTGLTLSMLIALITALLVEGVVSHTPVRHVIQVVPAALAALMVLSGKGDGQRFASAVFSIWVLIVTLIWLYLLGIANIIDGTFSLAERALTIVIGVTSVVGLMVSLAAVKKGPIWLSVVTFAIGIAVQAAALQISFGPAFATM